MWPLSWKLIEPEGSASMTGSLSIMLKAFLPAAFPSARALTFGVIYPRAKKPKMTPKKHDKMSPELYGLPFLSGKPW